MIKKEKCIQAILSLFPNIEIFRECQAAFEQQPLIDSMVKFAFSQEVIGAKTETDLSDLIAKHTLSEPQTSVPEEMTFDQLFRNKKEMLQVYLSGRALTDRGNLLIKTCGIALPPLTNTMLSRLKKEPADTSHKLNALRSLAFWIGYERPDLDIKWHIELLVQLCRSRVSARKIDQGVRIGLSLYSRGDVIDQEALAWLKKNIKEHIRSSLGMIPGGSWGKVRSYNITTIYVEFPMEGSDPDPATCPPKARCAGR